MREIVHRPILGAPPFAACPASSRLRIAKAIDVPPRRINEIVHGKRGISADTALRLSRALGLSDMFFINMQAHYYAEIAREQPVRPASDRRGGWRVGWGRWGWLLVEKRSEPALRRFAASPRGWALARTGLADQAGGHG